MMIKRLIKGLCVVGFASRAAASMVSFPIAYIGPTGSDLSNTSLTFTGDGYVTAFGSSFYDGLSFDNARTSFQVGISSIPGGSVINSALLEFTIGGSATDPAVSVVLFDSGGTLGYQYAPPTAVATGTVPMQGGTFNSVDVTSLLQAAVDNNLSYFALHFTGNTSDIFSNGGSSHPLTRNVDYGGSTVPEPNLGFVLGASTLAIALLRRKLNFKHARCI